MGEAASDNYRTNDSLSLGAGLILFFGFAAEAITIFFATKNPTIETRFADILARPAFGVISLALVAGSTAAVYWGGTIIAPTIGPIAILAWFGAVLLITSGHLGLIYNTYGYPLLSLMLLGAVTFSVTGWNCNHQIRVLRNVDPAQTADFGQAFREWLILRDDLELYQSPSAYPVYVISAEGGGVYAAYHAAMLLARLQYGARDLLSMYLPSAEFRGAV